ncbi:Ger(x)C family spore germination protein [Paenibacillus aurantius]|uniref:Ger(X)C family spore germination protein n=1 Tax=Paenibacillus aurantius TaxID=2918900 RepID=A0AA96LE75_9BACL|nr:Ger(x)C family spore germination protein [Paenibacillus aurantius]WNQ10456.1 Ger(x)C family spore germination protein [Paenibacillus aurantius]
MIILSGKNLPRMLLLLLVPFVLSGCWDRREINDSAFVIASAIDLDENGQYRVSVQVPLAGQLGGASGGGGGTGGSKTYYVDSESGTTITEAANKLQLRMARTLVFAHRRVLIIGEDLARKGIRPLFDVVARTPENRLSGYMIVAKGKGYDLLNAQPKLERFSGEAIRELVKSEGRIIINIKSAASALSSYGIDPVLAYVGTKKTEKSEARSSEVDILGYAMFKDDKMVDSIQQEAAQGLFWLQKKVKPYNFQVELEGRKVALIMSEGTADFVSAEKKNGKGKFTIKVKALLTVQENLSDFNMSSKEISQELEDKANNAIRREITQTIALIQRHKADPAGLGRFIWHKFPREWKEQYEKDWPDILSKAEFDLQIKTSITQIGLITQNIAEKVPR